MEMYLVLGLGLSGIIMISQVAIQGYFVKRRSLASCLGFLGNSLGKVYSCIFGP